MTGWSPLAARPGLHASDRQNQTPFVAIIIFIFDEAHRWLFKRFAEVIEYCDARMTGMTATPANFIDVTPFGS